MIRRALLLTLLAATGYTAQFEWKRDPDATALLRDGRLVWRFRHASGLTKPMFDRSRCPMERRSPGTLHRIIPGTMRSGSLGNTSIRSTTGKRTKPLEDPRRYGVAQCEHRNAARWERKHLDGSLLPCGGEPALLSERRQIEISAPGPDGRYHLDWSMTFKALDRDVRIDRTPIPGEKDGKAFGGYAGLSIRFAKEFQEWRAETTKGPVMRDSTVAFHCETGANGIDFSGRIAGREAGVAMLDEAANLNAPTPWYTVMNRQSDFSFSEAAVVYYRPHVLKAGEALTLRYRVIVHEGRWTATELGAAQAAFTKEVKGLR